ncbi:MAG: UbiA family prenyltransferase [Thermoplasmata archaeon]|nr:MAG: UbiA family prenyltransferase [Thermoplasmata archaeon]
MVRIWGKESWEKATFMPKKLRGLVDLIRPFTLLAPLIGGICGGLMGWVSVQSNPRPPLPFLYFNDHFPFIQYHAGFLELLIGASTLVILNAASNALNAVYDVEIDRINKPYRPIPSGIVTKDEARTVAWILYPMVLFRAVLVNRTFGLFVLLIMLITIAYSTQPLRLKKRLWVSNITIAFARGLLGFVAAWSIFGDPWSDMTPWLIGGVMMIFLIGAITSKDFTDIKGDKIHGIRTLPVVYGIRKSSIVSGPFFVLPFILIFLGLMAGALTLPTFWLVLLAIWGVIIAILMQTVATREEKKFENTLVWVNMYLMLMAMQIFFTATYVFDFSVIG